MISAISDILCLFLLTTEKDDCPACNKYENCKKCSRFLFLDSPNFYSKSLKKVNANSINELIPSKLYAKLTAAFNKLTHNRLYCIRQPFRQNDIATLVLSRLQFFLQQFMISYKHKPKPNTNSSNVFVNQLSFKHRAIRFPAFLTLNICIICSHFSDIFVVYSKLFSE